MRLYESIQLVKMKDLQGNGLIFIVVTLIIASFCARIATGKSVPPPTIRLYEVSPDGTQSRILTGDPDTEVTVGVGKEVRLECHATYPVQWVYIGNGGPILDTSMESLSSFEFKATALIPVVTEQNTGKYKCMSVEKPTLLSYFYIYAPGPAVFSNVNSGKTLDVATNTIWIPCTVTSPLINATLMKSTGLPLDRPPIYFPRRGFIFKVHDISQAGGVYICRASYMGTTRQLEYRVETPSSLNEAEEPTEKPHMDQPALTNCIPACSKNAQCVNIEGISTCRCPEPFKGDGYIFCEMPGNECKHHEECPDNLSCFVDSTCRDPCNDTVFGAECGRNGAVCTIVHHELVCACPEGTIGDPLRGCVQVAEESEPIPMQSLQRLRVGDACKSHLDCPDGLSCFTDGYCRDPCAATIHRFICGRNAICRTVAHRPVCNCPGGYIGDPYRVCVRRGGGPERTRQLNFAELGQFMVPMV